MGKRLSRRTLASTAGVCLAICAATLALNGCGSGSERTTTAYCDKYQSGFDEIKSQYPEVDQYSTSDDNPFLLILSTTSAYGDIVSLIGEMSEVAPDDIQSDTERVHETLQSQLDGIGDGAGDALSGDFGGMLGTLASGFMDSVVNAGSFRRMDQFIVDNCGGEHMFAASPQR